MRLNSTAVIGLQWGDEGKGKIIDFLSEDCDAVVRFGGGSNAGHTIVIDGQKFILRLLPSGVFRPGKLCFIGPGVACDPEVLDSEITAIEKKGIPVKDRVFLDFASHLVLPLHKERDSFEELSRGKGAIDTTRRGIGPSYADRISRLGIRVADLLEPQTLNGKLENILRFHNICTGRQAELAPGKLDELIKYLEEFKPLLVGLMADVAPRIMKLLEEGKSVLFEGAQGSLLDVNFGTYPYTTSSNTTIGGVFIGLGLPPSYLGKVIGIVKSYTTRVGFGPFPTELNDELGVRLRERGHEFGSVTGRPRRTGWLDMVALKRMIKLNGVTHLALTKLDVLDGLKEILVCESYEVDGKRRDVIAPNHPDFFNARPVYTSFKGWSNEVAGKTTLDTLPAEARTYVDFIERSTGVPVLLISTGFGREETIVAHRP
jgi:adenylosuccinate synthase